MTNVSEHAVVEGELGSGCTVGHFAVIAAGAVIGDNCVIHPHAVINDSVVIGDGVEVFPHAVIGREPKTAGATTIPPKFERSIRIGNDTSVGPHATIYYDVEIGSNTLIGDGASLREGARIGSRCLISRFVTLNYDVVVEDGAKVLDYTHLTGITRVGAGTFISVGVMTTNDNAPTQDLGGAADRVVGITTGKKSVIGAGAVLLPGVTIGDEAVVAAGAVVTKDVEPGTRVFGTPARPR